MNLDLTQVPTAALQRLRDQITAQKLEVPLTAFGLRAAGLESLAGHAEILKEFSPSAMVALLDAVLAERQAHLSNELVPVWTGPETKGSTARDTAVVLEELFLSARASIVIAGFRFDHGSTLLRSLHGGMRDRSVRCAIFLDRPAAATFLGREWPFGPPFPELFVDKRDDERHSSVHAKCVIVDSEAALITSANFTDRGQHRNVEMGLLIRDPRFARQLEHQWMSLVSEGYFERH